MAVAQAGDLARLVDTLCASGRSAEARHRVSLLLLSAASPLLSRSRFDALLRARTPILTLRLLQQAAALAPSLPNYNRLLALLYRSDSPPLPLLVLLAHRLPLCMRAPPDAASYAALLDGYARVADPRAARKLLDEMPSRGLVSTSLARTFPVKAFLRSRDVDAAMDLVDNRLWPRTADTCKFQGDQEVTNAAFANLVQSLCAEGFFHVVFRIAEEMPQRRCHVDDEFAYAQMIDSLCQTGKQQLVMEGASFDYRPREVTYKVLVDELCRENELIAPIYPLLVNLHWVTSIQSTVRHSVLCKSHSNVNQF